MSKRAPEPFAAQRERTEEALIELLSTGLDLAFTFLQTARIEAGSDPAHCEAALKMTWTALESVRHFMDRIRDPRQWQKIHARANTLESALRAFRDSK